jgi:long-chain acyl-CoA synthetase
VGVTLALARTAQVRANHIATIDGERRRTWAEFADRAARGAGALRSWGVLPGDRVAVLAANSDAYLELLAATPWAGGVLVPMNIRWSEAEIADGLADSGPRVLIVDPARLEMGRRLAAGAAAPFKLAAFGADPSTGVPSYEAALRMAPTIPDENRSGDDLFGIFYTGGTTGRSRGVMLTHRNVLTGASSAWAEGYYREEAVYLVGGGMFHASGTWPGVAILASGGTCVVMPSFTPGEALRLIAAHRVTESLLVPAMIQMLIEHEDFARTDMSSFQQAVYGAAPITEALLDRALAALPGVRFIQAYGQTELSPLATTLPFECLTGASRARGRHRSAGRATFGVQVEIVDSEDRRVPRGEVGEIIARGDNVMKGYWRRPEETAAALRNGWMHTGDAGYMDEDGFIYVVDRVRDMIVSGGENVYSIEVENAIAKHPAVRQCAVIGIPSEQWGEQVHAVVVLHPGQEATADALVAHARSLIAGYKIPRSLDFHPGPLPLSPANKILKRDLRAPFWVGRERAVN